MEHIVQFGVTIDDEKIEQEVTAQVARKLRDEVDKFSNSGHYGQQSELQKMANEAVDNYIKDNIDVVINKAVESLTERLMKTKKVKEALQEVL